MVDTGGRYRTRDLEALSCIIGPRAGGWSVSNAVSILFVVHNARVVVTQNENYYSQALPFCLSDINVCDQISLAFLPPHFL